jgi:hypothetical protein
MGCVGIFFGTELLAYRTSLHTTHRKRPNAFKAHGATLRRHIYMISAKRDGRVVFECLLLHIYLDEDSIPTGGGSARTIFNLGLDYLSEMIIIVK